MSLFLHQMFSEIVRVLKPGGLFLLLTDLDYSPATDGSKAFASAFTHEIERRFRILFQRNYELKGFGIYDSVDQDIPLNCDDLTARAGIVALKAQAI